MLNIFYTIEELIKMNIFHSPINMPELSVAIIIHMSWQLKPIKGTGQQCNIESSLENELVDKYLNGYSAESRDAT